MSAAAPGCSRGAPHPPPIEEALCPLGPWGSTPYQCCWASASPRLVLRDCGARLRAPCVASARSSWAHMRRRPCHEGWHMARRETAARHGQRRGGVQAPPAPPPAPSAPRLGGSSGSRALAGCRGRRLRSWSPEGAPHTSCAEAPGRRRRASCWPARRAGVPGVEHSVRSARGGEASRGVCILLAGLEVAMALPDTFLGELHRRQVGDVPLVAGPHRLAEARLVASGDAPRLAGGTRHFRP